MPALRIALSLMVGVILVGAASTQEKNATNKEKIVGKWEMVKSKDASPAGSIFEFTKDAKVTLNLKADGKDAGKLEGKYEIDGNSIKVTLMLAGGKKGVETWKIKTLADKEMVLEMPGDGKPQTAEFKKK